MDDVINSSSNISSSNISGFRGFSDIMESSIDIKSEICIGEDYESDDDFIDLISIEDIKEEPDVIDEDISFAEEVIEPDVMPNEFDESLQEETEEQRLYEQLPKYMKETFKVNRHLEQQFPSWFSTKIVCPKLVNVSGNSTKYVCEYCNRFTHSRYHTEKHMYASHKDKDVTTCKLCNSKYETWEAFVQHKVSTSLNCVCMFLRGLYRNSWREC